MKYIDSEKLIAEIERRMEETKSMKPAFDQFWAGQISAFKGAIKIAEALQQEQDSVAERFARIVRGNLIGIDKEVQQKFEQLYFEVTGNKMYEGYND